jgi:hypothetical protein
MALNERDCGLNEEEQERCTSQCKTNSSAQQILFLFYIIVCASPFSESPSVQKHWHSLALFHFCPPWCVFEEKTPWLLYGHSRSHCFLSSQRRKYYIKNIQRQVKIYWLLKKQNSSSAN